MKKILLVSMLAIACSANAQDSSAPALTSPTTYEVQATCTDGDGYINRECANRFEVTRMQKVNDAQIRALQELAKTDPVFRAALNNAGIGASK